MGLKQKSIVADIQVLRAVAILMVLAHHSEALFPNIKPTMFQQGLWAGVDLFFCISGFVIMRSLLRRFPDNLTFANSLNLCSPFWVARFWRIMPSAFLWLIVLVINTWIISPERLTATMLDATAALLQVANLHFYNCAINHAGMCGNGAIYWTLSLEFQFYLLLPLFLLLCPKKYWAGILVLLLVVQLFIPHAHWTNLHSFIRTESFIFGVLIALLQSRKEACIVTPRFLTSCWIHYPVFLLLVLLLCVAGNQHAQLIPNSIALTAILSGALVFIASYNDNYLLSDTWIKRSLLWVGDRSYSIYLLHPIVLGWVCRGMQHSGIDQERRVYYFLTLLAGTLAVAVLAELNYRLIERKLPWSSQKKG